MHDSQIDDLVNAAEAEWYKALNLAADHLRAPHPKDLRTGKDAWVKSDAIKAQEKLEAEQKVTRDKIKATADAQKVEAEKAKKVALAE